MGRRSPFAGVIHDNIACRVSPEVAYCAAQPSEGKTAQGRSDFGHARSQVQQRVILV